MGRSHLGIPTVYDKLRHLNTQQQQQRRSYQQPPEVDYLNYPELTSPPVELTHFAYNNLVSDIDFNIKSRRARKSYRLLERDKNFLLGLKQLWQDKLEQLQMEHHYLQQMCAYSPLDLHHVPPVFRETPIDSTSTTDEQREQSQLLLQRYRLKQEHTDEVVSDFDEGPSSPLSDRVLSCQSSDFLTADDLYTDDDDDSFFDSIKIPTLHSGTTPPTPVTAQQKVHNANAQTKHPVHTDDSDSDDYFDAIQDKPAHWSS